MTNHPPTKAELQASFKNISNISDRSEYEHDLKREATRFGIPVDEYRRKYEKAQIRASFVSISDTHDRLQHEHDLDREAKRLHIPVEEYRRYYEHSKDVSFINELPEGANFMGWVQHNWRQTFPQRHSLQKWFSKHIFIATPTITAVSALLGVGQYYLDGPQRNKQAISQAFQTVYSTQSTSANKIDALQDLVRNYGADLAKVDLRNAYLGRIQLSNAKLSSAKLDGANLNQANLDEAKLDGANLDGAKLVFASLRNADLKNAKLRNADISADLDGAKLNGADIANAKLQGATNIKPEQITEALNWQEACYDPDLLEKLKISQNPKCDENENITNSRPL
jgi:hypothetical protein